MRTLTFSRSIAFNVLWGAWTALFGPLIPLLWIVGTPPKAVRALTRLWARGILALLSAVVGLKYERRGERNLPATPSLIVINHESTWETLAALVLFPNVAIIAKRELLRIPVMGWYLHRSPMILIDRDDAAKALRDMLGQSRLALAAGRSVLIFPEGSRKRVGEEIAFKRGVELLYRSLDVPVVPVVVDSGRFWGIDGGSKKSGVINVSILPPISPGMKASEFVGEAQSRMRAERARVSLSRAA